MKWISRLLDGPSASCRVVTRQLRRRKEMRDRRRGLGLASVTRLVQEVLEPRLALTIGIYENATWTGIPAGGGASAPQPGFVTIVSDGDDVFLQQVATSPQDLLVADNSSFHGYQSVIGIDSFMPGTTAYRYQTVYVTNGTAVSALNLASNNYPTSAGTPPTTSYVLSYNDVTRLVSPPNPAVEVTYAGNTWQFTAAGLPDPGGTLTESGLTGVPSGLNTTFALARQNVNVASVTGQISYSASVGTPATPATGSWNFVVNSQGVIAFTPITAPVAGLPTPMGGSVSDPAGTILITWNAPVAAAAASMTSVSYVYRTTNPIIPPPIHPLSARLRSNFINAAADSSLDIVWSAPPIVDAANGIGAPVVRTVSYEWSEVPPVGRSVERDLRASSGAVALFTLPMPDNFRTPIVPGTLTGTVSVAGLAFEFQADALSGNALVFGPKASLAKSINAEFSYGSLNPDPRRMTGTIDYSTGIIQLNCFALDNGAAVGPQDVGPVTIVSANYAISTNTNPMQVTFFPGHDITREVIVDLTAPGSAINVESPIRNSTTTATALAELGTGSNAGTVDAISVVGGGGVYLAAPTITIAPPAAGGVISGTAATATATIDASGTVIGITIMSPGSGYSVAPVVTVTAPTSPKILGADIVLNATTINIDAQMVAQDRFDIGPEALSRWFDPAAMLAGRATKNMVSLRQPQQLQALANASVRSSGGGVENIVVTPGYFGAGYSPLSPPSVTLTGGGLDPSDPNDIPAVFTAIVSPGGSITGFFQVNAGSGYTSVPTVTIAPPSVSSQAIAAATVNPDGTVGLVTVSVGGGGYTRPPLVTLAPPPAGSGGMQAEATAILTNGVVTGITVTYSGSGYDPATSPLVLIEAPSANGVAERVFVNSAVAATIFDIRIADDLGTNGANGGVERGQLFVSATGSLSGNASPSSFVVNTPARDLFVQADISDIIVEGTIYANNQSYLLRSKADRNYLAPFDFTTRSPFGGADTGLIRGSNVAVTMGNDAPTPQDGATAFQNVELSTAIGSFRIKAAAAQTGGFAFPYSLTINERDDIQFDAVAASSNPISLAAGGSIVFSGNVATQGDLSILAVGQPGRPPTTFRASAPISTTLGKINIVADSIVISNTIRVKEAAVDSARDDITLTATGGSIAIVAGLKAVNTIRLVQNNLTAAVPGAIFGPGRMIAQNIDIESEGSVDVHTNTTTLSGRAVSTFFVEEANDISISTLSAGGLVSLTAAGVDPEAGAAMTANLFDVGALVASAPSGSVAIFNNGRKTLVLGDAAALKSNNARAMNAAGNVSIRSSGNIDVLDSPLAGGSARAVRVATTAALNATYAVNSPGTRPSTLTGSGSINSAPGFDGIANLRVGERVLVKDGSRVGVGGVLTTNSNGIYTITQLGGSSAGWLLTRSADADTRLECLPNTFARATEGTVNRDKMFQMSYVGVFGQTPIAAPFVSLTTDIGSDSVAGMVTFVVSTTGATNSAAGSLGKMISLRAANAPVRPNVSDQSQLVDFKFSETIITPIRLTQALPVIRKGFSIDGTRKYGNGNPGGKIVVDGSRISQTNTGTAVVADSQVNGFEMSGTSKGMILRNLTIGGFSKGSAVQIVGSKQTLLEQLELGLDEGGKRLNNKFGILIQNGRTTTTVLNSKIYSSTNVGVSVQGTATGVALVGNTIGSADLGNKIGVEFTSSGTNRLGAEAALAFTGTPNPATDRVSPTTFTLPSTASQAKLLFVGQAVTGNGIQAGTIISAIDGLTITLSNRMTSTRTTTFTFNPPKRNAVQFNVKGVVLSAGTNTVTNTDISTSLEDGIRITGGTQSIGTSTTRGSNSNAIFGNGGWGVNVLAPAVASGQKIQGNYFGSLVKGTTGAPNAAGDIAVNTASAPPSLGWTVALVSPATVAIDREGNQHVDPGDGPIVNPTPGPNTPPKKQPWRA